MIKWVALLPRTKKDSDYNELQGGLKKIHQAREK
jgi:hypothetical protein